MNESVLLNNPAESEKFMDEVSPLLLVTQLCEALDTQEISYCHWKSNAAIRKSESGENDLDLLIYRSDIQHFREIVSHLGFKECLADQSKDLPGVQSYFGYDQQSGKLIHIHAHFQLILGHDLSKNYHLPIEKPYLESSQKAGLFKIPSPEFELIIFVIRMIIKHSTWDTILSFEGKLKKSELQELDYLKEQSNSLLVDQILNQYLPFIDSDLFGKCIRVLTSRSSIFERGKTGSRLLSRLDAQTRYPRGKNSVIKVWQRFILYYRWFVLKHRLGFRLANGGAMIAILGGDGSGKTTAVEELHRWLSPHFSIRKVHMGKPDWSLTTVVVRGILKIGRSLGLYPFMKAPIQYDDDEKSIKFPGYPWLIREVLTGRDRFLTYVKARRFANNGGLVISDRYPVPGIQLMDSAQGQRMTINFARNWFIRWMIKIEERYYSCIKLPEIVILLKTNPEVAVQRKTDEDPQSVRARNKEMWEYDWSKLPVLVIDANQSKEIVLAELKRLVWSTL